MRKVILWIFLLAVLCQVSGQLRAQTGTTASASCNPPTPKWTAVLTAHPDDWQLFMGSAVCEETQHSRRKIVFICLTGGQADEPADIYWQTREAGHRASVRQSVELNKTVTSASTGTIVVNGHSIEMYRQQNVVAFYLHLPDGGVSGRGLSRGGFQSLQQLRDAGRPLTPLNGGKAYVSWEDLRLTVKELLAHEAIKGQLTMHIPLADARSNPGDHSDHYLAGVLAQHVMKQQECRFFQYVGYDVSKRPVNLSATQQNNQRQVYKAYCQTMVNAGQPDPWDAKHLAFIGHQYMQVRHQAGPQLQPLPSFVPSASTELGDVVDAEALLETKLILEPAYPNPFSESTQLVYSLPVPANVWLRIVDMQGREVMQLLDGSLQSVGRHEQWLDVQRFPAAGTYIAELRVGHHRRRHTLSVVR
ncbi:PIG-L family deacetylase [Hymenobacter metallilatus]|uniref:T9SS C-terminal target domain-containing protein n=1 Tax=Hymenobacter metallilatus TaxID=2493666 RepID=A0A3R9M823_9BACT|nr:PIG-L family deacetylase [Hymenobacter metallilatus]RSK32503.1 T9SS C-terminal target domain-containing protein [Hymenobacter metallilatus]